MGIEKISPNSAAAYHENTTASALTATPVQEDANLAADATGTAPQVTSVQNFSLDAETDKNKKNPEEGIASDKQLKKAVNDLNKQLTNSEAIFGVHEKTNRVTIKIVDKTTKEVLKEYPPEQTLDMIAKVWEVAGILVDEKR